MYLYINIEDKILYFQYFESFEKQNSTNTQYINTDVSGIMKSTLRSSWNSIQHDTIF
jgi:hypothetical protein